MHNAARMHGNPSYCRNRHGHFKRYPDLKGDKFQLWNQSLMDIITPVCPLPPSEVLPLIETTLPGKAKLGCFDCFFLTAATHVAWGLLIPGFLVSQGDNVGR